MIKSNLSQVNIDGNADIQIALDWVQSRTELAPGVHEIRGKEIFAIVQNYETKDISELKWEGHRKYIDIQLMISGEEEIGVSPLKNMSEVTPYDEQGDVLFFEGEGNFISVQKDDYLILYPQDIHMPGKGSGTSVKKAVLKVLI